MSKHQWHSYQGWTLWSLSIHLSRNVFTLKKALKYICTNTTYAWFLCLQLPFFYRLSVLQGNLSTWYCSQIQCCIFNITVSFTAIPGSPMPLPLLLSLKAASTPNWIYHWITRQNCCYSFHYLNSYWAAQMSSTMVHPINHELENTKHC